jgi:hypothetical protein
VFVPKEYSTLSDLLAEGWAKAIATWEKQNQLPVRFDGQESPTSEKSPGELAAGKPLPLDSPVVRAQ